MVAALVAGKVPVIPVDAHWPIDFVPSDVVADAIATAVEDQLTDGTYWLTAGDRALRIGEAVALVVAFSAELGKPVRSPRVRGAGLVRTSKGPGHARGPIDPSPYDSRATPGYVFHLS